MADEPVDDDDDEPSEELIEEVEKVMLTLIKDGNEEFIRLLGADPVAMTELRARLAKPN